MPITTPTIINLLFLMIVPFYCSCTTNTSPRWQGVVLRFARAQALAREAAILSIQPVETPFVHPSVRFQSEGNNKNFPELLMLPIAFWVWKDQLVPVLKVWLKRYMHPVGPLP